MEQIKLDEVQVNALADWAAIDAWGRLEKAATGGAAKMVSAYRDAEPLVALIELLRRERPREADGSWPATDTALARDVAARWQRLYEKEIDDGARMGEVQAKSIIEALNAQPVIA